MGRGRHISICRLGKLGALLSQLWPSPSRSGLVWFPPPCSIWFSLRFFSCLNVLFLLHGWESDRASLGLSRSLIFLTLGVRRSFFYALGVNSHFDTWIPALKWGRDGFHCAEGSEGQRGSWPGATQLPEMGAGRGWSVWTWASVPIPGPHVTCPSSPGTWAGVNREAPPCFLLPNTR